MADGGSSDSEPQATRQEFEDYVRKLEPLLPDHLAKSRAPYESVLRGGEHYYFFMSWLVDQGVLASTPQGLRVLFAKGATGLAATIVCLRMGLMSEAVTLLRTLLETDVFIQLALDRDAPERLQLYEQYEHVLKWKNAQANRLLVESGVLDPTAFNEQFPHDHLVNLKAKYDSVVADYGDGSSWAWGIFNSHGQKKAKRVTTRSVCEHLGRLEDYVRVYKAASISTHASSLVSNTLKSGVGHLTLGPTFNQLTGHTARLAVSYAHNIVRSTLKSYGPRPLGSLESIEELLAHQIIVGANVP